MPADRRRDEIARLEASIASLRESVEGLAATVGDPEVVVDERGWLPGDRREQMLMFFQVDRERTCDSSGSSCPSFALSSTAHKYPVSCSGSAATSNTTPTSLTRRAPAYKWSLSSGTRTMLNCAVLLGFALHRQLIPLLARC
jgi:hypothetical protein